MAAQAVSLFLNGDVSFLPENDFPSQIQLLQVMDALIRRISTIETQLTKNICLAVVLGKRFGLQPCDSVLWQRPI